MNVFYSIYTVNVKNASIRYFIAGSPFRYGARSPACVRRDERRDRRGPPSELCSALPMRDLREGARARTTKSPRSAGSARLGRRSGALAAVAGLLLGAAVAHAEVDRNIFRAPNAGVEIVFPADWAVSEQPSYPYLLASAIDRTLGGRMTLTTEQLREGEKLRECTERNRNTLKKVGFKVQQQAISLHPTGALVIEVVTPDGRGVVRQAYRQFDEKGTVFVLTLSASRENMQRYRRAFDDALRGLTLTSVPVPKMPTPSAPPATPPGVATDPSGVPSE